MQLGNEATAGGPGIFLLEEHFMKWSQALLVQTLDDDGHVFTLQRSEFIYPFIGQTHSMSVYKKVKNKN